MNKKTIRKDWETRNSRSSHNILKAT